nr:hypothetical protein [Cyanothece sp. BG0011]
MMVSSLFFQLKLSTNSVVGTIFMMDKFIQAAIAEAKQGLKTGVFPSVQC